MPAPPQEMVFWLTIDTVAAQLAAEGNSEELRALVEGLARQHGGFFDTAWRVGHPATADVLEAMGRLHPDKKVAKEARKAAFKARSQHGGDASAESGARRRGAPSGGARVPPPPPAPCRRRRHDCPAVRREVAPGSTGVQAQAET